MTWGKIDDRFHGHSKARRAGVAIALWTLALSWSCGELTDGHVPADMPELLIPGGDVMAAKLVAVGLWERAADGYQFHDWLDYQPSAREVRKARDVVSTARAKSGRKGMASRWSKTELSANSHEKSDNKPHNKAITNALQNDNPVPVPVPEPKYPPLNPPQGVGLGTLPLAKEKDRAEPSNVLRLPSREYLGVDPHEIAANHLGRRCSAFANFPGGMLNEFREATAPLRLTTEQWDTLGDWFSAGGTRTHRKNRPGWRWLLSGDVLVKSLADCKRWNDSNRPELGPDGLILAVKIQPKQAAKPAPDASTILADLAEARANKATKEESQAAYARHLARVAAAKAEEESRLANVNA